MPSFYLISFYCLHQYVYSLHPISPEPRKTKPTNFLKDINLGTGLTSLVSWACNTCIPLCIATQVVRKAYFPLFAYKLAQTWCSRAGQQWSLQWNTKLPPMISAVGSIQSNPSLGAKLIDENKISTIMLIFFISHFLVNDALINLFWKTKHFYHFISFVLILSDFMLLCV